MHPHCPNTLRRRRPRLARRGYALMLVLTFIVLFLAMLGIAWRNASSALRIAAIRSTQEQRDHGSLQAVAKAVRLLETGLPPTTPYVCGVTIDAPLGPQAYTVTFTAETETNWSIYAIPTPSGETPIPMPNSFGPAAP